MSNKSLNDIKFIVERTMYFSNQNVYFRCMHFVMKLPTIYVSLVLILSFSGKVKMHSGVVLKGKI